ncbi:hypothetical protein [Aeromonas sp. S16(2024)]|uniref:hypothetical protein n=1 Tax=Aeromonas sp. S16(2024) TaxID=3242889 RepID=UPI003526F0AA
MTNLRFGFGCYLQSEHVSKALFIVSAMVSLLAGALLGLTLPFGTLRSWALHMGSSPEQSATMTNAAGNRQGLDLSSKKAGGIGQERWGALRTNLQRWQLLKR